MYFEPESAVVSLAQRLDFALYYILFVREKQSITRYYNKQQRSTMPGLGVLPPTPSRRDRKPAGFGAIKIKQLQIVWKTMILNRTWFIRSLNNTSFF